MVAFTVPAIFKAVDKITAPVRKMQASVKGFGRSAANSMKRASLAMNQFNRRVNSVFVKLKRGLGTLGLVAGFTALTMVVGGAVQKFADFEQANAGLSAVMNTTLEKNKALTADAKRLGAVTAKSATEVVGLQEAFARLGFAEDAILNMTGATINGSVAMKGELADTAELVGAMVKSFDNFESVNAPKIIDQLTKSTQKSALNFEKLQTALPIVAGAANAAKVPFTRLLASIGKLSDAGIDASSSSTALRNIFLEAAKRGVPYETLLKKVVNSTDQLATANELFGKRGAVAAVILAKNMNAVDGLDRSLQNAGGTAQRAADKQLNTLHGSVTILKSAWEGWILSLDDGNGSMSSFLKTTVKTITEILSMATGTAKAREEMTAAELRIRIIAERVIKFGKVLKILVIGLVAFKVVMLATNIAIGAHNILLGISQARSASLAVGVGGSTLALNAQKIATYGLIAAQWLYNGAIKAVKFAQLLYTGSLVPAIAATWAFTTALLANPMTWVVIGIMALIAGIVLLVVHWKDVVIWIKKVWEQFKQTKFIQDIINKFNFFVDVIKMVVDKLKEIGTAIKTFIIDKFKAVSEFVAKIVDRVSKFFGRKDKIIAEESVNIKTEGNLQVQTEKQGILQVQAEKQGNLQDITGRNAGVDLVNNLNSQQNLIQDANKAGISNEVTNNREVVTREQNSQIVTQNNSRVDLFLNNRAQGTEAFAEGTGVEVHNTGY